MVSIQDERDLQRINKTLEEGGHKPAVNNLSPQMKWQIHEKLIDVITNYNDEIDIGTQAMVVRDMDEFLYSLTVEDERRNLCPDCHEEVAWVKGWYDCPNHGQLKEHPILDIVEDESKGLRPCTCDVCRDGGECIDREYR